MPENPNAATRQFAPQSSVGTIALVPDHELIRLIGRGSYGEVWLLLRHADDDPVNPENVILFYS